MIQQEILERQIKDKITDKMVEDDKSGIKIDPNGPAEFESNGIKFKVNTKNEDNETRKEHVLIC